MYKTCRGRSILVKKNHSLSYVLALYCYITPYELEQACTLRVISS